uniref:Uncharacterized protein n=1 Tax=Utricularia reniformis TaxID=192314 RepID=A0A1Y0B2B0_9LAMI|nr:hypothetical protein AEK19_MT1330 [Utricularia reniformis]ART31528.1 hypothetical protein AEK19_MT1330 [Utricularia reniformis]
MSLCNSPPFPVVSLSIPCSLLIDILCTSVLPLTVRNKSSGAFEICLHFFRSSIW